MEAHAPGPPRAAASLAAKSSTSSPSPLSDPEDTPCNGNPHSHPWLHGSKFCSGKTRLIEQALRVTTATVRARLA